MHFLLSKKGKVIYMRIDAYNQVNQIYNTDKKVKSKQVSKSSKRDEVEISSFGRAYQTARQAVSSEPDIREEKVADIKARIQNGTYEVSGEKFAEKILGRYDEYI